MWVCRCGTSVKISFGVLRLSYTYSVPSPFPPFFPLRRLFALTSICTTKTMKTRSKDKQSEEDKGRQLPTRSTKRKRADSDVLPAKQRKTSSPDKFTTPKSKQAGEKGTGGSEDRKETTKLPAIAEFSDDALSALLTSTPDPNTREAYATAIVSKVQRILPNSEVKESFRLLTWALRFRGEAAPTEALGREFTSLGYGSIAGQHRASIDKVITEMQRRRRESKRASVVSFLLSGFSQTHLRWF